MKLAKTLTMVAALSCCLNAQPAYSSEFVKNLLNQFSGTVSNWDDLESRNHNLEVQIRQNLQQGAITSVDADQLRNQLNPVVQAIVQGRQTGKPLSFTQGLMYTQTINNVTAALQQAVGNKQATMPDIDALQVELAQKIDEALNANQLTGDDATKLKGQLRTVADIESTIKSSGDGTLSPKQIQTISDRLFDVKTQLAQAIKTGQSAVPELSSRLLEIRERVGAAVRTNQITRDQSRHMFEDLDHTDQRLRDYGSQSQFLNGRQVLELAGHIDRVAADLQSTIAANQASAAQASQQATTPPPGQYPTQSQYPAQTQTPPDNVNVVDLGDQTNVKKYPDVVGYWGEPYISGLASRGMIGGFPDGTFHPNDNITRAQFAAIAVKAFNVPAGGGSVSFNDVGPKYWGANAIGAVSGAGLVTGFPDGTFKPEDKLTRAQALVILAKALGASAVANPADMSNYSDAASVPAWAAPSVGKAASAHIIANFPDPAQINPNAFSTRGEVAALMYQTLLALKRPLPRISIGLLPQFATATQAPPVTTVPVQQPAPPPVQQPEMVSINNVEITPSGQLSAGDVLTIRAFGTPNAVASFSIREGVRDMPMEERRDGVYVGQYTVRKSDNMGRTRVSVSLRKGDAPPASSQSRQDLIIDAMPPDVRVDPEPNGVSAIQPNIVVRFNDGHGSGVDPTSVHLIVNDIDVTGQSVVDPGMVAYRAGQPLPGKVRAQIKLADKCGNAVDYRWEFTTR